MKTLKDENIDYSDIPAFSKKELNPDEWEVIFPEEKQKINIALDKSILEFFKQQGKGYQTRINAVLSAYIKSQEN